MSLEVLGHALILGRMADSAREACGVRPSLSTDEAVWARLRAPQFRNVLTAGITFKVELKGKNAAGADLTSVTWGPETMAAGAIVDITLKLRPIDPEAGIAHVNLVFLVRGIASTSGWKLSPISSQ